MTELREASEDWSNSCLQTGIWKPRTRPSIEGEEKLDYSLKVKKITGLPVMVEVANSDHVEACLNAGIDILWIGARTTVNPFAVQRSG